MSIPVAYLTVVVVWATTPLAIAFSGDSIHPVLAAGSRMTIAALLGLMILAALRIRLPWRGLSMRSYSWAQLGIFGALSLTYVAAQSVPSGLISVLFGLSPMVSAVLARWLIDEPAFPLYRWGACLVSLSGLVVLFLDDVVANPGTVVGLVLLFLAMALFSLSAVMVKKVNAGHHPLAQTVGSLLVSLPLFALTWWLMDGHSPTVVWTSPSPWAILYLAVFGSLLGFVSYFHVLRHLPTSTVALITLITPAFALYLGHWLNDEPLSSTLLAGSGLVLAGLGVFFFGGRLGLARKVSVS